MDTFVLVSVWLGSMATGALLCIGVIQVVTGRRVINPRPDWSVSEIRATGACSLIQGALGGLYTLYGGLVFLTHADSWGLFVSVPFGLLFCAMLLVQAYYQIRVENRHRRRSS
jgi:hypothetical protein